MIALKIVEVDPQGADAMALLREAAIEARNLYPEQFKHAAQWPENAPATVRGIYLLGYLEETPVVCGALRPIDETTVEVRRVFVTADKRRNGLARVMLGKLDLYAARFGYTTMRLETGCRQLSAIALYESIGYKRIKPFGEYLDDPLSVCFEKVVRQQSQSKGPE